MLRKDDINLNPIQTEIHKELFQFGEKTQKNTYIYIYSISAKIYYTRYAVCYNQESRMKEGKL